MEQVSVENPFLHAWDEMDALKDVHFLFVTKMKENWYSEWGMGTRKGLTGP